MDGMPEDLKKQVEAYIKTARQILNEGPLQPMTIFGAHNGESVGMFPWTNMPDTETATQVIRHILKDTNASWVITVMEAYIMDYKGYGDLNKEAQEKLDKYGQVKDMPGSHEGVVIFIETHDQSWVGQAPQQKMEGGHMTFGELDWFPRDGVQYGRFIGLLGSGGKTPQ